jgi:hypothetical protein
MEKTNYLKIKFLIVSFDGTFLIPIISYDTSFSFRDAAFAVGYHKSVEACLCSLRSAVPSPPPEGPGVGRGAGVGYFVNRFASLSSPPYHTTPLPP